MKNALIPFTKDGEFLNYAGWGEIEWIKNYSFKAEMKLTSIQRGRSSANFELTDLKTNKKYTIFMKDLFDFANESKIENGVLSGNFTFCKRGSNYGIKGDFLNKKI